MSKRKTDEPSPVVKALCGSGSKGDVDRDVAAIIKKEQAIFDAKRVIYSAVSDWIGETVTEGSDVPIVRDGKTVGYLPKDLFGSDQVEKVTSASKTESKREFENKVERFAKVTAAADALMNSLNKLSHLERATLNYGPFEFSRKTNLPVEERIVREIGYLYSALIACSSLKSQSETAQKDALRELEIRRTGVGRPRNYAAYAVALELARLYAKVTGKRPTYSEDPNGVSGEYTPALRDVFDSLGWGDISLSGPAEAAKSMITDEDLDHPKIGPMGGITGLSIS